MTLMKTPMQDLEERRKRLRQPAQTDAADDILDGLQTTTPVGTGLPDGPQNTPVGTGLADGPQTTSNLQDYLDSIIPKAAQPVAQAAITGTAFADTLAGLVKSAPTLKTGASPIASFRSAVQPTPVILSEGEAAAEGSSSSAPQTYVDQLYKTLSDRKNALQKIAFPFEEKYADKTWGYLQHRLQYLDPDSEEYAYVTELSQKIATQEDYKNAAEEAERDAAKYAAFLDENSGLSRWYNDYQANPDSASYGMTKQEVEEKLALVRVLLDRFGSFPEMESHLLNLYEQKDTYKNAAKYSFLSKNADFSELSSVIPYVLPGSSEEYDRAKVVIDRANGNTPGTVAEHTFTPQANYYFLTDDEVANYLYLYNKEGIDSADQYLLTLEKTVNARHADSVDKYNKSNSEKNPFVADAVSVGSNLISILGLADAVKQTVEKNWSLLTKGEYTGGVDYNTPILTASKTGGQIRSYRVENINNKHGVIELDPEEHPFLSRVLNGKGWGDVYQLGMSTVDSAAAVGLKMLGIPGASVLLGGAAGTQGMLDALERGATDEEALGMGIMVGAFEMIFEEISLDKLLSDESSNLIVAMLKQSVVEGTEELSTSIANTVADCFVMAGKSDLSARVAAYRKKHPEWSESRALKEAWIDVAIQYAWDYIGGSASGGFMGGSTHLLKTAAGKTTAGGNVHIISNTATPGATTENAPVGTGLPDGPQAFSDNTSLRGGEADVAISSDTHQTTPSPTQDPAAYLDSIVPKASQQQSSTEVATSEQTGVKTQLRASQSILNSMQPVAQIDIPDNYYQMSRAEKITWIAEKLQPTGYKVDRKGFGIIDFAVDRIKKAFRYFRRNSVEDASFEAIPYILQYGEEISSHENHKGRDYGTVTFAAPVIINGRRGNMAVVVTQTSGNHYKVHRVLTPDGSEFVLGDAGEKSKAEPTGAGESPETGSLATPKGSASDDSIRDPGQNVNPSIGAADQGFDPYSTLQFQHGNKPDRAGTVRDINVPNRDSQGRRVSDMAANLYGNAITDDATVPYLERLIEQGYFGSDVKHNRDTLEKAQREVAQQGIEAARDEIVAAVTSGITSDDLLAKALVLYADYQATGNLSAASDMAVFVSDLARTGSRALNVAKLTSSLTPEGQLAVRQKLAAQAEKQANAKRKDGRKVTITISDQTQEAFKNAANAAEAVVTDAAEELSGGMASDVRAAAKAAAQALPRPEVAQAADTGVRAGTNAARSAMAQAEMPTADSLYSALMDFINSKKKRTVSKKQSDRSLRTLLEYYRNKDNFTQAWWAARRQAELAVSGDEKARAILDEFFYSADAMLTDKASDPASVSRKAVREAAKAAGEDLGDLLTASLADQQAALARIQNHLVEAYDLSQNEAKEMAQTIQTAFFEELADRQSRRLKAMFSQKSDTPVSQKSLAEKLRQLAALGAFDEDGNISREALKRIFGQDGLSLPSELMAQYKEVSDARRAHMDAIIVQEIADQLPGSFADAFRKLRYGAMLANPSSHISNLVGSAGQTISQVLLRDNLAAIIEWGLHKVTGGKFHRTKALLNLTSKADVSLLQSAFQDYGTILHNDGDVARRVQNGGRYDYYRHELAERRRAMKVKGKGKATKAVNKVLGVVEGVSDKNADLMNVEDAVFGRNAYAFALAGYMKANGLTEITEDARAYAIAQAQECTFHDESLLYEKLKKLPPGFARDAIAPFLKTPSNVAQRAIDYSPVGIAKVGYDLFQMLRYKNSDADNADAMRSKYTGAKAVSDLSSTIVGSMFWAVGALLAHQGLIRINGTGSEEEREYDELMGAKPYSAYIGGQWVSMSNFAPTATMFFTGAAIYETLTNFNAGEASFEDVLTAIFAITDPIMDTTMLSGLDGIMYAIRYADEDENVLVTVGKEMLSSYVSQYYPALLRRIAYASDNTVREQYEDPSDPFSGVKQEYMAMMPGLRSDLNAKYDIWGRPFTYSTAGNNGITGTALRTASPFRSYDVHETPIDGEIKRLLSLGFDAMPTAKNSKTVTVYHEDKDGEKHSEKVRLTDDQYETYQQVEGQSAYQLAKLITASESYAQLPDKYKTEALQLAYEHANELGKAAALDSYTYDVPDYLDGITDASQEAADRILTEAHRQSTGLKEAAYADLITASGVDDPTAARIGKLLEGLTPEADHKNVRTIQELEAIMDMSDLNPKDEEAALRYILDDKLEPKYDTLTSGKYALSNDDFVETYRAYLDGGETKAEQVKAIMQALGTGNKKLAEQIYDIYKGSAK